MPENASHPMPLPDLWTDKARAIFDAMPIYSEAPPELLDYTNEDTGQTLHCVESEVEQYESDQIQELPADDTLPDIVFENLAHYLRKECQLGELNDDHCLTDQPEQVDALATLAPYIALALTVAGSAPLGDLQPQQLYTLNLTGEEIMRARALAAATPKA